MSNIEISIIMPVYNAGKYLPEALDCVLAQDFTRYRLYCIDDCSDDGSYEVLVSYQKKDGRIQVYRNEKRMGAAYSRNFALEMIDAPYVGFVDADDIIEPDLFSELYQAINTYQADIAYCEWDVFEGTTDNIVISSRKPESGKEKEQARLPHTFKELSLENTLKIANAPWLFLLRRAFLKEAGLEFQSLPSRNDVYFFEMAKMLAKKMVHVSDFQALVHQRRHDSASRIGNLSEPMNRFHAYLQIKKGMEHHGIWDTHAPYFYSRCLGDMRYEVTIAAKPEQKGPFFEFLQKSGLEQLGICRESLEKSNVPRDFSYFYDCFCCGTLNDMGQLPFRENLLKNSVKVQELLQSFQGKKVAFWGMGRRMDVVWELFEKDIDFPVCFIDTRKAGGTYQGRRIVKYEQIVNENDIIVLLNSLYRKEIINTVDNCRGTEEIVELDKYLA